MQHAREKPLDASLYQDSAAPAARVDDDTLDIREVVGTLLERRSLILGSTLACALAAAAWTLVVPSLYDVSMVIEPPITAIMDSGVQSADSVSTIKAKIESGIYNVKIANDLGLQDEDIPFRVFLVKETRFVKVRLIKPLSETEQGKHILESLLSLLNADYAQILSHRRSRIENQIKSIRSRIGVTEGEIKLQNEQYRILTDREQQFMQEIKDIRTQSERMFAASETIFSRRDSKEDLASLFYASSLQQNANYASQLQTELSNLRVRKESIMNAIDRLRNAITESRIEIDNLTLADDGVRNVGVIQEPVVLHRPINPRKREKVLIAALVGLVFGVCAAFFLEHRHRFVPVR